MKALKQTQRLLMALTVAAAFMVFGLGPRDTSAQEHPTSTEPPAAEHDHEHEHDGAAQTAIDEHDHDHEDEHEHEHAQGAEHDPATCEHDHGDAHDHGDPHDHSAETLHGEGEAIVRTISLATAETIGLELHTVECGPLEEIIELLGTTEAIPDRRHVIAPRTSAQVLHVHVQIGDTVRKGDVLVELDSPELARNLYEARRLDADYQKLQVEVTRAQGRVTQLEFEQQSAVTAAQLTEAQYARLKQAADAVALNVLNEMELAAMQARVTAAQKAIELRVARDEAEALNRQADALKLSHEALLAVSNIDPAQAEVLSGSTSTQPCPEVTASLGLLRLVAPIDGVVVARTVSPGQGVTAGESLMVVADYQDVQVHGELPESLLGRLTQKEGTKVRIRPQADPMQVIDGRVRFISPMIDPVKRTAHLIVDVPNPNGVLREGAFATVAVIVRDMDDPFDWPLVVPAAAVLRDGPAYYVFVQDHPGELVFTRRDITPGARNDELVEVRRGLLPADRVVTRGAYNLGQMRAPGAAAPDPHAGHNH